MIIVDDVLQVIRHIESVQDPQLRSHEVSLAITYAVMATVYYVMLGTAVIVLGRRIINATLKAWRESRREPA